MFTVKDQLPVFGGFNVFLPLGSGSGEVSGLAPESLGSGKMEDDGSGVSGGGQEEPSISPPPPLFLYTQRNSVSSVSLRTHDLYGVVEGLEDNYTCVAENEFAINSITIFLDVNG